MSNHLISLILHVLVYLTDAIFVGSKILVPLIFLLKIFKIKIAKPDISVLLKAVNTLILFSGLLFLIVIITNFVLVLRSGSEDEFGFMMSQITGAHWFQFVLPVIGFGLLTQIFWLKRMRSSVWISFGIVLSWFGISLLINLMTGPDKASTPIFNSAEQIPWFEYGCKFVLFLVLLIFEYLFLNSKRK